MSRSGLPQESMVRRLTGAAVRMGATGLISALVALAVLFVVMGWPPTPANQSGVVISPTPPPVIVTAAPTVPATPTSSPSASPPPTVNPTPSPAPGPSSSPASGGLPGLSDPPGGPGTVEPSPGASDSPEPSPVGSPNISPPPSPAGRRYATRVLIPALKIDLPVVRPPNNPRAYPWCNVAMYIRELSQPGERGTTYIYAHAREGMFLKLLSRSRIDDGASMIGMHVFVFTSDNLRFAYRVTGVYRNQLTLDRAYGLREQLMLQTSEGPRGTPGKLQVAARPVGWIAVNEAEAHPTPRPVACG